VTPAKRSRLEQISADGGSPTPPHPHSRVEAGPSANYVMVSPKIHAGTTDHSRQRRASRDTPHPEHARLSAGTRPLGTRQPLAFDAGRARHPTDRRASARDRGHRSRPRRIVQSVDPAAGSTAGEAPGASAARRNPAPFDRSHGGRSRVRRASSRSQPPSQVRAPTTASQRPVHDRRLLVNPNPHPPRPPRRHRLEPVPDASVSAE
jgi:hypothetical protein